MRQAGSVIWGLEEIVSQVLQLPPGRLSDSIPVSRKFQRIPAVNGPEMLGSEGLDEEQPPMR